MLAPTTACGANSSRAASAAQYRRRARCLHLAPGSGRSRRHRRRASRPGPAFGPRGTRCHPSPRRLCRRWPTWRNARRSSRSPQPRRRAWRAGPAFRRSCATPHRRCRSPRSSPRRGSTLRRWRRREATFHALVPLISGWLTSAGRRWSVPQSGRHSWSHRRLRAPSGRGRAPSPPRSTLLRRDRSFTPSPISRDRRPRESPRFRREPPRRRRSAPRPSRPSRTRHPPRWSRLRPHRHREHRAGHGNSARPIAPCTTRCLPRRRDHPASRRACRVGSWPPRRSACARWWPPRQRSRRATSRPRPIAPPPTTAPSPGGSSMLSTPAHSTRRRERWWCRSLSSRRSPWPPPQSSSGSHHPHRRRPVSAQHAETRPGRRSSWPRS